MTLIVSDDVILIITAPDYEFMFRASKSYILSVLILCSGDHCDELLGLPFVDIMFDLCLCFVCVSCYHVMSV